MEKSLLLKGRIWPIVGADGQLINNIDTDMIFHNQHLAITDQDQMGPLAFGNLEGWQDFPKKAGPGDLLLVGGNFGAGSSRQQAVDCFRALGITAIIAKSFGAIYKRNAINSGLAILEWPTADPALFAPAEEVRLNLETGQIFKDGQPQPAAQGLPLSEVQRNIYLAGGLFEFGRQLYTSKA